MSARRIELAPGTFFYPHADRVLWTEESAHPCMSWPLPLTDEQHGRIHDLALAAEPEIRSLLFAVLSIDSAYHQMTLRDARAKRDHVCAMLRKAARSPGAPGGETNGSNEEEG